jgi:hypothetical protein
VSSTLILITTNNQTHFTIKQILTMNNSVTISIRSFGNPSPEADRGKAFRALLDSIGLELVNDRFVAKQPNPLGISHVVDIPNGSVHKVLNDHHEVVLVINQEEEEPIRSPPNLDIEEQSVPITFDVIPEYDIILPQSGSDVEIGVTIKGRVLTFVVMDEKQTESQLDDFAPKIWQMMGMPKPSIETPHLSFKREDDGKYRLRVTLDDVNYKELLHRQGIQEQGLDGSSPKKSPLKRKSLVRASFKKQINAKTYCEIKKIQKNLENIKNQKNKENVGKENKKFVLPDVPFGDIFEQGFFDKKYNKMVNSAKLVQRLSDHDVGGGLGKKKRLNRLISQGDAHRYSGAKKKCPIVIEERIARKSSQVARSISMQESRDLKSDIQPQMYPFSTPSITVSPDAETLDTIREMSEAIKNVKLGLDPETIESVDKLTNALSGMDGTTINHEFSFFKIPDFLKGSALTCGLTALVMLAFSVYKGLSYTKAILAGCGLFAVFYRDEIGSYAMDAFQSVVEWATSKSKEKQQDYEDHVSEDEEIEEHSIATSIVDSMIAFLYYSAAKRCMWDGNLSEKLFGFFSRTRDMRKLKDGLEFTFSYLLSHIQTFIDWLASNYGFCSYNICMDNRPEITLYAEKVAQCVKQFTEGRILNSESSKDVINLYAEGNKLAKQLPSSLEYVESRKLVQATVGELNHLMMKIRRSNLHNNGPRIQPVGIFITGPPGIGKTTAITPLMLKVTAQTIPEDMIPAFKANHNDFIYNRVSENEYFDAYNGQYNVLFDDLGLTTDVAGVNNNPYMEFIRMVNSNSYDLHMAHLDDKGTTGFCSKFVWVTSNVNKFNLKSMINSNALTRRFTCSYLAVPAPGYREDENETDFKNMVLKKGIKFDAGFPHIDFYEYDALNGIVISTAPVKMQVVADHIMAVHAFTQEFGKRTLELHETFKNEALEARFAKKKETDEEKMTRSFVNKRIHLNEKFEQGTPIIDPATVTSEDIQVSDNETISDLVDRLDQEGKDVRGYVEKFMTNTFTDAENDLNASFKATCDSAKCVISNALKDYKSFIFNVYSKVKNLPYTQYVINNMKTVLAGLATITAGYGIYKTLFSKDDDDISDQGGDYAHKRKGHLIKPKKNKAKGDKFKPSKIRMSGKGHRQLRGHRDEQCNQAKVEQLAYDPTCDDVLFKIYKRNVYTLSQNHSSEKMGTITFIGGHDAFMPRHFAENLLTKIEEGILTKDTTVILRAASTPVLTYEVRVLDIQFFFPDEWEDMDICFATFPNIIPQAPDIRKFVMEDSEVITQKFSGKLVQVDNVGTLHVPFTEMHPMSDLDYTNYSNPHGYWYPIPTKQGDCGGLIFVSNPLTGVHKLIGMHVAGSTKSGTGYGIRLTKSMIDEFDEWRSTDDYHDISEEGAFDDEYTKDNVEPQSFKTLYKSEMANPPTKTTIIPSPLQDVVREHKFKPAHLRKFESQGKTIDPWFLARSKYAKSAVFIDQQVLNMCSNSYGSMISNKSKDDAPWTKKVFSFEEAVRGVPGIPNCEGVPRNTSAGYPYCLDVPVGHRGKSHFFGSSDEYEFTSDHCKKLKARVEEIISKAKKGIRLKHIYFDFLKDERRPIEKVDAGSTRLVSASPVDMLISTRMYFMDFVRWYMNNRIINGSAVGVNPFSSEWGIMKKCLRGNLKIKNIIAGDFKTYDACLVRQIQCSFLDFVNSWYDDGNDLIRAVLFEEVCNSKHIYMDLVYEWSGGNPSGNFLTTILNTYCNNVILRYAGILAYKEYSLNEKSISSDIVGVSKTLKQMENQLYILAYGDDNIISVGENIRSWYNQASLTRAFKKFGFEYTSENKGGEAESLRSIDDVTFLKRSWKHDPLVNCEVAALDIDVILEMIQWTKKKDRDYNYTCVNVDTCLKELSAHGEAAWKKWSGLIIRGAKSHLDYTTSISNRREALALQLSRENESC